jgi:hypothetical protein
MIHCSDFHTKKQYPWKTIDLSPLNSHPWVRLSSSSLFLVPISLLEQISSGRGREGAMTDIGDGTVEQLPLEAVWRSICEQGMRDPLVIAIGLQPELSTVRLESGNHRIWPARKAGLTHLPVIGMASSRSILNEGNGMHTFPFDRSGLDEWLRMGGRSPENFDPYPHPVDLEAALSPMSAYGTVIPSTKIHSKPAHETGLAWFRDNRTSCAMR